MRRLPSDLLNYIERVMGGDPSPKLPVRKATKEQGDGLPRVTSTPEAVWWLFSRHKDDKPIDKFIPKCVFEPNIYWKPWSRPDQGIDVDRCIEDLIIASDELKKHAAKSTPRPKRGDGASKYEVREIISRENFSDLAHKNGEFYQYKCPYEYVRRRLAEAVGLAYDDEEADRKRRSDIPDNLKSILKDLCLAKESIESAIAVNDKLGTHYVPEKYTDKQLMGPKFQGDWAGRKASADLSNALRIVGEAEGRFEVLRQSVTRPGTRENVWWVSFVKSCGSIWTTLTGVPPNLGHPGFEDFLRSTNKSLGGDRGEFNAQIKTALLYVYGDKKQKRKGMSPWDQLDAERNGVLSSEWAPLKIYNEDETRLALGRFERSILNHIEKFKGGDTSGLNFIQLRYMRTDDGGKRLIENLLKRHGIAHALPGVTRVNH